MNDSGTHPKIFISYAQEDLGMAKKLHQDLEARGYQTWIDFVDLLPGEWWPSTIAKAINECRYFIALISRQAVSKKGFVQRELKEALKVLECMPSDQIYLIPVRLDDCTSPEQRLMECHWVDLFPSYQDGFEKLLQSLPTHPKVNLYPFIWEIDGNVNNKEWSARIRELPVTIGRDSDCEITLPSMAASGKHAEIAHQNNETTLIDLSSTNGTFVNAEKISGKHVLDTKKQSIVHFADFEVRMRYVNNPVGHMHNTVTVRLDFDDRSMEAIKTQESPTVPAPDLSSQETVAPDRCSEEHPPSGSEATSDSQTKEIHIHKKKENPPLGPNKPPDLFSKANILLAFPSVTIQKVIELIFLDSPIRLVCVTNEEDAKESLKTESFDIVVAGVNLSKGSGYEVCAYAKKVNPKISALLLSRIYEPFNSELYKDSKADEVLEVPFDSADFTQIIQGFQLQNEHTDMPDALTNAASHRVTS